MKRRVQQYARPLLSVFLIVFVGVALTNCVKRSLDERPLAQTPTQPVRPVQASTASKQININTAPAKELEKLPGIGPALAQRIVEHREKYGPFRRAEHLIIIRGISDKRFRALRDLITVE